MSDVKSGVAVVSLLACHLQAATAGAANPNDPPREAVLRLGRFSVGGGVAGFAVVGGALTELFMQSAWNPLPWVGVTGDLSVFTAPALSPFFPLAESARVGPTLRPWSLALAPVAPYLTAQIGLLQPLIPDTDDQVERIARVEAGIDIRLGKVLFMSAGGGLMRLGRAPSDKVHFFELVLGWRR